MSEEQITLAGTKKVDAIINSVRTSIIKRQFADYHKVLITQTGKIGTVVKVVRENPESEVFGRRPVYSVKVLLGPTDVSSIATAQAIAKALRLLNKPLILGFALKDQTAEGVNGLVGFLKTAELL